MAKAPLGAVLGYLQDLAAGHKCCRQPDGALLRAFLTENDKTAFEALLRRHGPMVLRVCMRALGHVQEAEDAFQATFLVLAQQAAAIRKQESLAGWLHGVALRMASRAKRTAARRRGYESRVTPAPAGDPALGAAWREIHVLLDEEIERLPADLRETFVACCLENKSCIDAAKQLGIVEATVWKRLRRARKLLRERLTRRGVSLTAVLAAVAIDGHAALAAVPRLLLSRTARAATQLISGQALGTASVSVNVLSLIRGVNQAMFLDKCKSLLFLILLTASLGLGAGWAALRCWASELAPQEKQAASSQAARPDAIGEPQEAGAAKAQAAPKERIDAETGLPSAVRNALEGQARSFGPIALTLKKQRSAPDSQSARAKQILGTFPGFLQPCTYEYLAEDQYCYARYNQWVQGAKLLPGAEGKLGAMPGPQDKDKFGPPELLETWQEFSWDGKCGYLGAQSLQPQILEIVPLEKFSTDGHFRVVTWFDQDDYFTMIGIVPPRTMMELTAGQHSEVLQLLAKNGRVAGTETKRLPGQVVDCFVVEVLSGGKKHRFWLDPSMGHAVRRHEIWDSAGGPEVVIDNTDFIKLADPELWLPKHCHAEWQDWHMWAGESSSDKTRIVVELQATRLERTRVPPERFTLSYKPGTYISDARPAPGKKRADGRVDYILPENPKEVKGIIQAAQEGVQYIPPRSYLALWILGTLFALLLAGLGVFIVIYYRKRKAERKAG